MKMPIHPRTGLRAIGMTRRGPVWPVLGGSIEEDWAVAEVHKLNRRVAALEKRVLPPEPEETEEEAPDDDYDSLTLDELKAEAKARQPQGFDTTGVKNKSQLIDRLRQWDREHPEEGG